MYDLINSVFNDDFWGFGAQPLSVRFSTPLTKDVKPMAPWRKDGNSYFTIVRVVGLNPEDVVISLEKYGLCINGTSEVFGEKYSQELKLGISQETLSNILSVDYQVQNGICKIILNMKEADEANIQINRI